MRRAEKEGEDPDEVEMILNARLAEIQAEKAIAPVASPSIVPESAPNVEKPAKEISNNADVVVKNNSSNNVKANSSSKVAPKVFNPNIIQAEAMNQIRKLEADLQKKQE